VDAYGTVTWLFLRGLGLVYFIACISLVPQIVGLLGEHGIVPACNLIDAASNVLHGVDRYLKLPTLAWVVCTDASLVWQCVAGAAAAAFVVLNILPGPALLVAWAAYLSLVHAGQDFLSFQWDSLLLESGFLGLCLSGWGWRPSLIREPPRVFVWAVRVVLFRLMFDSGMVKVVIDSNHAWRSLTALQYHFETQPLPNPVSFYVHQLPAWALQGCAAIVLVLELVVPFTVFMPRRLRLFGFALLVSLQAMIFVTGNYTFFNLLTVVLCLPLLDDAALYRLSSALRKRSDAARLSPDAPVWRDPFWLVSPIWVPLFALYLIDVSRLFGLHRYVPPLLFSLASLLQPFAIVSPYGLFATMTTERREIVLEASQDGKEWLEYELPYKPGSETRPPPFVAPHQPRLDWQLWFAALGSYKNQSWFLGLVLRLLEARPEVLSLFEKVPFDTSPPRYVRATLYRYTFAAGDAAREGRWWKRELLGTYLPPVTRGGDGGLEIAPRPAGGGSGATS
jgi:hypothetical protein